MNLLTYSIEANQVKQREWNKIDIPRSLNDMLRLRQMDYTLSQQRMYKILLPKEYEVKPIYATLFGEFFRGVGHSQGRLYGRSWIRNIDGVELYVLIETDEK